MVVAGLSVASSLLLRQGVDRQATTLLKNNAGQIELLFQSSLSSLQGQLRATAALTANASNAPSVFAAQAATLRTQPTTTVTYVDLSGSPRIVFAAGDALQPGPLPAALVPVAERASQGLSGGIVRLGGHTEVAIAAAPTSAPHAVALQVSPIDPSKPTPNHSGPYSHVYVNIYGSATIDPQSLILTTYGPHPLPGPVATAPLRLGSLDWLIAVSSIGSLVGGSADTAPWIVLAIGLLVAVMAGVVVEVLSRRQHYAQALAEKRTAELVEAQHVAIRQERLAAIGEMASVVSHELRNPLSAVVNDLFLLRRRIAPAMDEAGERHLANAEHEVFRAARLSEDLLTYARERQPRLVPIQFEELAAAVLDSTPPPEGVSVHVQGAVLFEADSGLLTQVLTNLLTNAYQAMPDGGTVRLTAGLEDGTTVLSVDDEGPGIDDAVADRLFDPFVTTKDEGTGLGLAIVHRLVEAHGGQVTVENLPGEGARFSVRIPGGQA